MKTTRADRLRRHFSELCLAFPGATETKDVFRIGREPFARFIADEDECRVELRVGTEEADSGYVTIPLGAHVDWEEIRGLVLVSYAAVAPKKYLQELDDTITT